MHLESIHLTQFKNYESEQLQFSTKVNCIVGLNGMGKTNLLDAIFYLCVCKSQFGINDRLIVQDTKDFFRLEGRFKKNKKSYTIIAKVQPKQRKEFSLNGNVHAKLADHIGLFPVVMITPFDIDLAMEGSEVRRRFLDISLSQMDTSYLRTLLRYNRILRQRNAALKSFFDQPVNYPLLDSLDEQLRDPAQFLHAKRLDFTNKLSIIFKKYYHIIANGKEEVSCTYQSSLTNQPFVELLASARNKDLQFHRSTVGIHKDDLQFQIKNRPLKKFASQGQLKSFILALKLAQYELLKNYSAIPPILLLDDIFDKLDNHRVQQLIQLLFDKEFGQIFFTDTQKQRLVEMIAPFEQNIGLFIVEDGVVNSQ